MELKRAELMRYVNLVFEKRYLAIILCLLIISSVVWGSYLLPKKYKAKSTIFIDRNVIEDLIEGIAITPSMDTRIRVLRDIMLSRNIILNVIRQLDQDTLAKNSRELERMIMDFQRRTRISVRKNALVTVSFVSQDPVLAQKYVNSLISEYLEKNIFIKREEADDATKFLEKQVAFFKKKIDTEEKKIIKFRKEQGIYVDMDERSIIDDINESEKSLEIAEIKRNELIVIKNSMEEQLIGEEPFTVTTLSTTGDEGSISMLENRLRQLLTEYTENYPEVVGLKAEIEAIKNQQTEQVEFRKESKISSINPIYQELKQRMIETESQIKALDAKTYYLKEYIENKKEMLGNIPENRKKLNDLVKEGNSFRSIYGKLMERLGQAEVSKQMEIEDKSTTLRVVEPAILPVLPVSPPRKMLILFGILSGFVGSLGVIFIMDKLDKSLKTIDALKSLGLPVLAIIPNMQRSQKQVRMSRKDVLIYSLACLYILCIFGVFILEVLGLTYVDEFINNVLIRNII